MAVPGKIWPCLGGLLFCGVVYAWNLWWRDAVSSWLTGLTEFQRHLPARSAQLIMRIPLYGVPGIIGYVVLMLARPGLTIPIHFGVVEAVDGLVLGGGLIMAGSALANGVFVSAFLVLPKEKRARNVKMELRVAKHSGWIRTYTMAYHSLPKPLFLTFTAISVVGEELAFRGVMLPLLVHGTGAVIGLALSVLAFVGIQKPFMPSWHSAAVPMSGALVVGTVLGFLAITQRNIFTPIMAHVGFVIVTILVFMVWDNPFPEHRYDGLRQTGDSSLPL